VDVVVLVDPNAARFGDWINVTALVFDGGAATDPSAISASVDKLPGLAPLTLARASVGVYKGVFVFESHPSVVRVNATVAGTQDSGTAVVYHQPLSVSVVPSKGIATPGERISVGAVVRGRDGTFLDADSFAMSVQIGYLQEPWSLPTNLNWTRISVGQYSAQYTVPGDIDRDAILDFRADAATRDDAEMGIGARVYVHFPETLLIWYRIVANSTSNATVEIDVASMGGVPLPNATISIRTTPVLSNGVVRQGRTDSAGAVRFEIPAASLPTEFYGNASSGSRRQAFQGTLGLPASAPPAGPRLVRENPTEPFGAGETAVLRFRLVSGDVAIPNQELFAYVETASRFVQAKKVSTDAGGRFAVRFVAPPDFVRLDISGNISGVWNEFHERFLPLSRVETTVSSADWWHFTISVRFPEQGGLWIAYLSVPAVQGLTGPWAAAGAFGAYRIADGSAGSSFAFDLLLPRFVPAGQALSVSISVESPGGGYGVFSTTIVAGTPIQRSIDLGVVAVLLVFGAVLVVAASGWRWKRNPSRPV